MAEICLNAAVMAPCVLRRCAAMLLFSAKQGRDPHKIVAECLLPWLQLLHAKTPGVSVILVCSHAQSPPEGWTVEDVRDLADAVHKEVLSPPLVCCHRIEGLLPL